MSEWSSADAGSPWLIQLEYLLHKNVEVLNRELQKYCGRKDVLLYYDMGTVSLKIGCKRYRWDEDLLHFDPEAVADLQYRMYVETKKRPTQRRFDTIGGSGGRDE